MGQNSDISWTNDTFNPWIGCTKVSPACDHCYAEGIANRFHKGNWGPTAPRKFLSEDHWSHPVRWNRLAERDGTRRRCFSGSMCDLMETHRDPLINQQMVEARNRLYELIEETPSLDWLLVTKRPQEFRKKLPRRWLQSPQPNVWLLTTVESQDYMWRLDELLKVPAVVYGLSIEPILGPIQLPEKFLELGGFGWCIVGGESGSGARKMEIDWVRSIRDQCTDRDNRFHFKQFGTFGPGQNGNGLVRLGVKKAGRELDGQEWNGLPTPVLTP